MSRCLTQDELERLAHGRTPFWRRHWWMWHVRQCRHCQAQWVELEEDRTLAAEIREVLSDTPTDTLSPLENATRR